MGFLSSFENSVTEALGNGAQGLLDGVFGGGGGGAAPTPQAARAYPERIYPINTELATPSNKIMGVSPLVLGGGAVALVLIVFLMVRK